MKRNAKQYRNPAKQSPVYQGVGVLARGGRRVLDSVLVGPAATLGQCRKTRLTCDVWTTLDVAVVDQLTLALVADMPKPSRPRVRSYEAARAARERAGASVLEATPAEPAKSAHFVVRIFYVSEGGEILACESDPLTSQGADKLMSEVTGHDSWAHGAMIRDTRPGKSWTSARGPITYEQERHARIVRLPSQCVSVCENVEAVAS